MSETTAPPSTLHHKGTAADMCRLRGWGVGTRLVGNEGYGPTVIEITAVGGECLLAKRLGHARVAYKPYESSWVLWCRDWREATPEDVPVPLAPGTHVEVPGRDVSGVVTDGPDSSGTYVVDCGAAGFWHTRLKSEAGSSV